MLRCYYLAKYVTLEKPHAFIAVRIRAAIRLATGLTKNEMGVARSEPVLAWMKKHIDPKTPLLIPLVWSVTNLTTQSPEYLYRVPASFSGPVPQDILRSFALALGPEAVVRPATDEILHQALFASIATPIIFDPVVLKMAGGGSGLYVDGGIASNSSIAIARTVAHAIDVVLVDPRSQNEKYANAVDVVMGSYETMQRKILETEMRDVFLESLGKRAFERLSAGTAKAMEEGSPDLSTIIRDLPAADLAYMRPKTTLPVSFAGFDEQDKLDATSHAATRTASAPSRRTRGEGFGFKYPRRRARTPPG